MFKKRSRPMLASTKRRLSGRDNIYLISVLLRMGSEEDPLSGQTSYDEQMHT